MKNILKETIKIIAILAIAIPTFAFLAGSWNEPIQSPPGTNVDAPINVGVQAQTKEGGLWLNTLGAAVGLIVEKGNVGIGTVVPSEKLEVDGVISVKEQLDTPSPTTDYGKIYATPITSVPGTIDSYTKLLLHMDGSNNSTNFVDSSGQNHSVAVTGDAGISTSPSKFNQSAYFGADSGYLTIPDSPDWAFGTEDFTIDMWVNFTIPNTSHYFVSQWDNSTNFWYIILLNTGKLEMYWEIDGTVIASYIMADAWSSISADTWYHLAFVRSGSDGLIFIDGVSQNLAVSNSFASNNIDRRNAALEIGRRSDQPGWSYMDRNIDELRISKGIARWTSNFTPPTAPYPASISGGGPYYMDSSGTEYSMIDGGGGGGHGDGSNCPAGQTPRGVDSNGNVQGCFIPSGGGGDGWVEDAAHYVPFDKSCEYKFEDTVVGTTWYATTVTDTNITTSWGGNDYLTVLWTQKQMAFGSIAGGFIVRIYRRCG